MTSARFTRLVVLGCVAMIVVIAGASAGTGDAAMLNTTETQLNETDQDSNAVLHTHPDSVAQTSNRSALEARFAGDLLDRLTQSAVHINNDSYEPAQQSLDSEYTDQLDLYMQVYRASESDRQRVEQQQELFAETAELQIQYAQTLAAYRQVRTEYEAAGDADDRDRAKRRAQELTNLTRELQQTEASLLTRYQKLGNTTPGSLETATMSITETTDETARQTDEIVGETYPATSLTAEASSTGSFRNAIPITGQLAADEAPPPDGNVSFLINGRVHNTTVASDGSFTLQYRPVTEPAETTSISVEYLPDRSALYRGSSTNVTTTITQNAPNVSINNATETARATSTLNATGRVTANDTSVPNTSVRLYIGDQQLAETRTANDGQYRFDTALPASIPAGTQTLSVRAGTNDTAIAPTSTATNLTVEETEVALTLSASRSTESVSVAGELVTETESGVNGQEVTVSLDGEQQQTVRTDADGNYEAVIELPQSRNDTEPVLVEVSFNGTATGLDSTAVSASLNPPGQGPFPERITRIVSVVGGFLFLFVAGYGLYRYRVGDDGEDTPPSQDETAPEEASPFRSPERTAVDRSHQLALVEHHLDSDDPRTAVLTLYGIVRRELSQGTQPIDAHWEFFESVADQLSKEQRSTLRELTAAFEAVRFAGTTPDPADVASLLRETRGLVAAGNTDSTTSTDMEDLDD